MTTVDRTTRGLTATQGRLRRLFGSDRQLLLVALRHPLEALAFEFKASARFGAYLALESAVEVMDEELGRSVPLRRDLTNLQRLQVRLISRGKQWPSVDPSNMIRFKGPLLYFLVRLLRPSTVVETGVASGISTAHILQALNDNERGVLVSIDLPGADPLARVPETEGIGWIVPHELRGKWTLILGDTRIRLPEVLARHGSLDMFVHDSLHTYAHMLWEFEAAWPRLREGGVLFSDDIDRNAAFDEFSRSRGRARLLRYGVGMLRK